VQKSPDPVDQHVGSRVRMRRLVLKLSQTRLADALGVTFQQVQKYEKGANRISASRLQQISHFLRVPIPFFFEGSPRRNVGTKASSAPFPTYVSDFLATTDGLSLIRSFQQIKRPSLRRSIVHLVERMADNR
jgi:transcriptional regulator with XRE-family HTH domain